MDTVKLVLIIIKKKKLYNQFEKIRLIKNIIKKYPKKKSSFYDCVIGVSRGKDSLRQAIWVRDKLGLKPLLVCATYPTEQKELDQRLRWLEPL